MELEPASFEFRPKADGRKRMEEPLPVSLEAVADLHAPAARAQADLHKLYHDILEFQPIPGDHLAFQAENFALHFDQSAIEAARDYRPIRVIVKSLVATEHKLVDAEIEYERHKSLTPGHESLVLQDADGNWVEIRQHREVG